jgi:anti-sigma factor RsiW
MDCREINPIMHKYFDGDIGASEIIEMRFHLGDCEACRQRFRQLERAEAMIRTMPRVSPSFELSDRIMAALPPERKRRLWVQWVKRHPAVSVAAVFAAVMLGSFTATWNGDSQLTVKGTDLSQVVIQGNTVYVPAGHTVNGDLTVKSGSVEVDGDVQGNLTVIDGSVNMASTAQISGEVIRINEGLSWLWFEVNEFVGLFTK